MRTSQFHLFEAIVDIFVVVLFLEHCERRLSGSKYSGDDWGIVVDHVGVVHSISFVIEVVAFYFD